MTFFDYLNANPYLIFWFFAFTIFFLTRMDR